jgi:nucleotide-binding universal stress UspA family protein
MERDRQVADRSRVPGTARRVVVAVHGREPAGWELEVCRTLTPPPQMAVRLLAVADVPSPPAATLLPSARRTRARAHAEWQRLEEAHVAQRLEALLAGLSPVPEVVWIRVADADPGRAIVEQAAAWGADLIVVGVDGASWLERRLLGAIHERVVARAGCALLVVPSAARSTLRRWGGASASGRGPQRAATAKGGA